MARPKKKYVPHPVDWLVCHPVFTKAFLMLTVMASVALVASVLFAQIEDTPATRTLDTFLGTKTGACPKFVNLTKYTMRDECTGITWARHQEPTYDGAGAGLGYTWSEAQSACAQHAPAGMFRVPTVEELLTLVSLRCTDAGCINASPLSVQEGKDGAGGPTDTRVGPMWPQLSDTFANGVFWTKSDFAEKPEWSDTTKFPATANASRDYKRTVNLLTGTVDSPVYGKDFRLNSWCVVDRGPEMKDHYLSDTGESVTVYRKTCSTDAECSAFGAQCVSGECQKKTANATSSLAGCEATEGFSISSVPVVQCAGYYTAPNFPPNLTVAGEDCAVAARQNLANETSYMAFAYTAPAAGSYKVTLTATADPFDQFTNLTDAQIQELIGRTPSAEDKENLRNLHVNVYMVQGGSLQLVTQLALPAAGGAHAATFVAPLQAGANTLVLRYVNDFYFDISGWSQAQKDAYRTVNVAGNDQTTLDKNVTISQLSFQLSDYAGGQHIEGAQCVQNIGTECNPTPRNPIAHAVYRNLWQGNYFNGDYQCSFIRCEKLTNTVTGKPDEYYLLRDTDGTPLPDAQGKWQCLPREEEQDNTVDNNYIPLAARRFRTCDGSWDRCIWSPWKALSCGPNAHLEGGVCACDKPTTNAVNGAGTATEYTVTPALNQPGPHTCTPRLETRTVPKAEQNSYSFVQTQSRTCDGTWDSCTWGGWQTQLCVPNADLAGTVCACQSGFADLNANGINDSCGKPEVCGNNIDDDFNGLIDDGCVAVSITVKDAGTAADDAFNLYLWPTSRALNTTTDLMGQTVLGQWSNALTVNSIKPGDYNVRSVFYANGPAVDNCGTEAIVMGNNITWMSGPTCSGGSCKFDGGCTLQPLNGYLTGTIRVIGDSALSGSQCGNLYGWNPPAGQTSVSFAPQKTFGTCIAEPAIITDTYDTTVDTYTTAEYTLQLEKNGDYELRVRTDANTSPYQSLTLEDDDTANLTDSQIDFLVNRFQGRQATATDYDAARTYKIDVYEKTGSTATKLGTISTAAHRLSPQDGTLLIPALSAGSHTFLLKYTADTYFDMRSVADSDIPGWPSEWASVTSDKVIDKNAHVLSVAARILPTINNVLLSVSKLGPQSGQGIVETYGGDSGISCGATCAKYVPEGTLFHLKATNVGTAQFVAWSDPDCGTGATCDVVMDSAKTITAYFGDSSARLPITSALASKFSNSQTANEWTYVNESSTVSNPNNSPKNVLAYNTTLARWKISGNPAGAEANAFIGLSSPTNVQALPGLLNAMDARWTSAYRGSANVSGLYSLAATGGDGVKVYIFNGSAQLGVTSVTTTTPVSIVQNNIPVTPNTRLYFMLHPNNTITSDLTNFNPVVTINPTPQLTVAFAGTGGGQVAVRAANGFTANTSATTSYIQGGRTYYYLYPTANANSDFSGWTGCQTALGDACVMDADTLDLTVTANFLPKKPTLTIIISGIKGGNGSVNGTLPCAQPSCSTSFDFGRLITLTQTADLYSTFLNWSGGCTGTGDCVIGSLNNDTTVTANYSRPSYLLGITKGGNYKFNMSVNGILISDPSPTQAGYTCSSYASTCPSQQFVAGSQVQLTTAISSSTGAFTGWFDAGGVRLPECPTTGACTVTVDAAKTITANTARVYSLQITNTDDLASYLTITGTVLSPDPAPNQVDYACGGGVACTSKDYVTGTKISLSASGPAGSSGVFTGWNLQHNPTVSGCVGTGSCIVTLDQDVTIDAETARAYGFQANKHSASSGSTGTTRKNNLIITGVLTTDPVNGQPGYLCDKNTATCPTTQYMTGTKIQLTATTVGGSGATFTGWSNGPSSCNGTTGPCTVTVSSTPSGQSITANVN